MSQRLSRVDLNLLVSLQVLLQERNATRAAKRLCITPSAMSKQLARLREVFGDELFIRTPSGLMPTAAAESLRGPLEDTLRRTESLVYPEPFAPDRAEGVVSIAISEPASALIVDPLLSHLKAQAPRLILQTHNVLDDYAQCLEEGRLDFCIYPESDCAGMRTTPIGGVTLACLMRADHPLAQAGAWSTAAFLEAPKIIYFSPDVGRHWLTEHHRRLREATAAQRPNFETSQLFTAVNMMLGSDYVMVTAQGLANCLLCAGRLVERPVPDIEPFRNNRLDLYLISHPRIAGSPLHRWLAAEIESVVKRVMPADRSAPPARSM